MALPAGSCQPIVIACKGLMKFMTCFRWPGAFAGPPPSSLAQNHAAQQPAIAKSTGRGPRFCSFNRSEHGFRKLPPASRLQSCHRQPAQSEPTHANFLIEDQPDRNPKSGELWVSISELQVCFLYFFTLGMETAKPSAFADSCTHSRIWLRWKKRNRRNFLGVVYSLNGTPNLRRAVWRGRVCSP